MKVNKMTLDKTYDPQQLETKWYQFWEKQNCFAPDAPDAEPYCIMIPPPNVTGNLHMGHAFQDLIMDALIRYHRMCGRNTLWQPGTDHAGIATQMVVERAVGAMGKTREEFGREKFIERIWQWKAESGGNISRQLRRLGASPDWRHERFTMDEGLSEAVLEVFVQLYDEGIIYRGKRLVNWDPVLLTAVSDLEVVNEEATGVMYYVRYPFVDGDGDSNSDNDGVVIGTTRPETILVDGAIAVHPDDERHRPLVGRRVWVPLTDPPRAIEVITDEYVRADFGTGCVKITAAHDLNDYEVYMRHPDKNIPIIKLLTPDAKMNDNAPKKYRGMDRYDARRVIAEDLRAQQFLVREEKHSYKLPRCDRSGAVVEPMLTNQWYVDLTRARTADGRPGGKAQITDPAIAAVKSGRVQFVPSNWAKTYYQWLDNIQDWCISRQIWWGHRIPAWYDDDGNVYVARDEDAVRKKYNLATDVQLRRDEDVLDTWFSSALWPFSTLGWPDQTARLKTFYPTSVLVTGFDIIFFWVARMIMMGEKFAGDIPFHQVYIHGLVRDAHGNKMSKSKGNVLDPIDLIDGIDLESLVTKRTAGLMRPQDAAQIEKQTRADFPQGIDAFGADALRFTFAALASTGRDINFDLGRTGGYRNFCNKIWNAARFVLMHCQERECGSTANSKAMPALAERWMISTLHRTIDAVHRAIQSYRFDLAAQAIYELIWNQYCDWYVELAKPTLNNANADPARQRAVRGVLVYGLESMLRLVHPIMPFISEEIWQSIAPLADKSGATIMKQPYPRTEKKFIDANAEQQMREVMDITLAIRQLRSEHHIAPGKRVDVYVQGGNLNDAARAYIATLAKTKAITTYSPADPLARSTKGIEAVAVLGDKQIILIEAVDDPREQITRLQNELSTAEAALSRSQSKLANANFIQKAPAEVVAKERGRVAELQDKCDKLTGRLGKLQSRV